MTWPLYTDSATAPWVAASVPALASLHVLLTGVGFIDDKNLVAGASVRADEHGSDAELPPNHHSACSHDCNVTWESKWDAWCMEGSGRT